MNVLGIHIGHDSGASLVMNGKIIADVAEERFVRVKHYCGMPVKSIEFCLKKGNIQIADIDAIAIPTAGSVPELNHLLCLPREREERKTRKTRMIEYARRITKRMLAKPPLYLKNFPLSSKTEIVHVEHHLAHAASAYYTGGSSGKALICTIDGAGDGFSVCLWKGEGNKIKPLKKWETDGSIGWFYSNVTEALGWWHGDGEGKTMGLAPYGDYHAVKGKLDGFYPKYENGNLVEAHDFGVPYFWNEHGAYQFHFEDAYKIKKLIDRYGREPIAAEAQRVLEEQIGNIALPWMEKEQIFDLFCAGGVFLNVKLNQRLWYSGKIRKHHIFPNPGDSGLSLGAALFVYFQNHPEETPGLLEHLYWGPDYGNEGIRELLDMRKLSYEYLENPSATAARLLASGKILAWFQGRMESGPRALGNRSILMSPLKAENKDIINAKVKFREPFRPFCPSLLAEDREIYLKKAREEPFMITSFEVQDEKRERIPAVVHVDQTLRPQTVCKEVNLRYWELIKAFGDLTGETVVLNTSLNIRGEPIICQPSEAIRCFFDSGIDALILGNYLINK